MPPDGRIAPPDVPIVLALQSRCEKFDQCALKRNDREPLAFAFAMLLQKSNRFEAAQS
jgi:hypothetical protein